MRQSVVKLFWELLIIFSVVFVFHLLLDNNNHTKFSEQSYLNNVSSPGISVDFEDMAWGKDTDCCRWLENSQDNVRFLVSMQGHPDYVDAWLENNITKHGSQSLGAWLKTPLPPSMTDWKDDPHYEKQRVEFEMSNRYYNTHHLEEVRYYKVSLYIDPTSADWLKKGVFFMQADQSHDTDHSKYPAFFLRFSDNSAYRWEVNVSRDADKDSRHTHGTPETIYSSESNLALGVWHDFTVRFKPSVRNNGEIEVRHNGESVVSRKGINLGYLPQESKPIMHDYFWVRFGIYRRPEPDKPGDVKVFFDNAKTSDNFEFVE